MNYKILALLSGFFISLNILFDGFNLKVIFDNLYNYAVMGAWTAVIITLLLTIFLGKKLDPGFKKFGTIPKKSIKYAIIAGIFASGYTFYMLYLIKKYDPAVVSALIPFTVIFLIIRDIFYTREKPSILEISSFFMVIAGAILVSFNGGQFNFAIFLSAGILLNLINAAYSHFMKMGMSVKGTDSLNFRLIITFVLAIVFTIYSYPHIDFSGHKILSLLPYVIGSMFFAFLSYISYLIALKEGKVSTVSAINLSYIGFVFIFSLALNFIDPSIFSLNIDILFWVMRFIGNALIVIAILTLLLTEFSSLIFINCYNGKCSEVLKELEKIDGIRKIYNLFGAHQIGIVVTAKSEKKLRETIIEKIQSLKGVKSITESKIIKIVD